MTLNLYSWLLATAAVILIAYPPVGVPVVFAVGGYAFWKSAFNK